MASLKSQLFIQALAELRKKRITIVGVTSQEIELNPSYRYEVDWVVYPRQRRFHRVPTGKGAGHYERWCHLRVRRLGPRPFAHGSGKTVGERFGMSPSTRKPRWGTLKTFGPQQVYAAAARQSSFASLPWGKSAGTNVTAADMRGALDSGDVIEFETDDALEQDVDEATVTNWKAIMEADKPEVQRLWTGITAVGMHLEREVPLPLLLTRLGMAGHTFDPEPLEDLLSRWTGHRPGSRTVDIAALGQWFQAR